MIMIEHIEGDVIVRRSKRKHVFCWLVCLGLLLSIIGCSAKKAVSGEGTRLPVVMYHHLTKDAGYANDYTLPVDQFEQDLKYIQQQGYQTITLAQLIEFQKGQGELPDRPIMITFDDGFESFEAYAVPLLKKYGMQAVLAVVGDFADKFTEHEDHNVSYSYLSWQGIAQAAREGNVEIISHTYSMHNNDGLRKGCNQKRGESDDAYRTALQNDLNQLQEKLTECIGTPPRAIAFPYGRFNSLSLEIVKNMGFDIAFSCRERVNIVGLQNEDFLLLGRYNRASGKSSASFFKPLMNH